MESNMSLDISNGGLLYQIFYTAAFLAAYAILAYEGYRRKFPIVTWLLILASVRLAVVTGTRLFAWTPEEWQFMTVNHIFLPAARKTMFGGFALGVAMYLLVSRILRFRHNPWDTLAYAFPAAVAIQSVGCFFYGCCFGTPADIPWAVRYPVMSLAHFHQFEAGLINYGDTLSLPVHPVQLYETAGALAVIALVFLFRNRWKLRGSLLLSSVAFFCGIRFIMEFFRDPISNKSGGELLLGIKAVQWQYLVFGTLFVIWLIWRELRNKRVCYQEHSPTPSLNLHLTFLLVLVSVLITLREWFTLPEAIALNMALIPALILTGIELYNRFSSLRFRWVYAAMLVMPLLLMSQTLPQTENDTVPLKKYHSYHTIGGGFATGSYTTERSRYSGSGCDRVVDTRYYRQDYTSGTLGYIYTRKKDNTHVIVSYGGSITAGRFNLESLDSGSKLSKPLVDISTFIRYDDKWLGTGAGLHVGSLYYNRGDCYNTSVDITTSHYRTFIMPSVYIRIGPENIFFADVHLADHFPASAPGLSLMAGVGTGFGASNGFKLRTGMSVIDKNTWYFTGYLPIADRIVIEPLFMYTGKIYPEYPAGASENQFTLGISYRFGHK
ncbi:MAG: prolipoprotein diacylglyceryl transferase [Bacteroidales bacterium]